MSTPGWYPDPGGRSGHYRFWDGRVWSPTTSTQIPGPTPPPDPGGPSGPPRRRRPGLVAGLAAGLVLVLVVVGLLVLRPRQTPTADPLPSGATSAAPSDPPQTSGPAPSAGTPGGDGPSESPGSPTPSTPSSSCPVGDPAARQEHPDDGRVHGGGISIPRQQGWTYPGEQSSSFTWAYDVGETDISVQPQWFASYAVGALSVADGFEDPRSAAELSLECTLASDLYRNVVGRPSVVERRTTVGGYPAFTVVANIRVRDDRTTFAGDTVVITVVDVGSPESLAFFWGCAPIGEPTLSAQLAQVARQIRVD